MWLPYELNLSKAFVVQDDNTIISSIVDNTELLMIKCPDIRGS